MGQPTTTPPGGGSWDWDDKKDQWVERKPEPAPDQPAPATAPAKSTPAAAPAATDTPTQE